jgi:hypothetical protein
MLMELSYAQIAQNTGNRGMLGRLYVRCSKSWLRGIILGLLAVEVAYQTRDRRAVECLLHKAHGLILGDARSQARLAGLEWVAQAILDGDAVVLEALEREKSEFRTNR